MTDTWWVTLKIYGQVRLAIFEIRNLNLEVALHSMLLALWPSKFVDSLCKKPSNNMDELRERANGTFRWKKCWGFEMKFDRLNINVTKGKVAQGPTRIGRTSDTNTTSVSLFQRDLGMSIIQPWRRIEQPSLKKLLVWKYPYSYPLYLLLDFVWIEPSTIDTIATMATILKTIGPSRTRSSVNHASFDEVKKNFLDNDCHHQKVGECECMNTWFWWCQRRIKQGCFKG